ncbi:MAG: hypothetical protein IJB88_01140 [Clostridia bacterium]|nr:hypothetical protein [Clostridia bacterium]
MEVWYTLLGIAASVLVLPYIRMFFKRLICMQKIKKLCKQQRHLLHAAHPLWFLGRNHAKTCDLYVETEREVFAVKLFGLPHKNDRLMLKEDGTYVVQRIIPLLSFASASLNKSDSRSRPIPVYHFRHGYRDAWELKTPRHVLLLCPDADVRRIPRQGAPVTLGVGDRINGMELFSMSHFLRTLENAL